MRHPVYEKTVILNGQNVRFWLHIPHEYSCKKTPLLAIAEKRISLMQSSGYLRGEIHIPLEDTFVSGYWLLAEDKNADMTKFIEHAVKIVLGMAERQTSKERPISNISVESLVHELLDDWIEDTY